MDKINSPFQTNTYSNGITVTYTNEADLYERTVKNSTIEWRYEGDRVKLYETHLDVIVKADFANKKLY